MNASYLQINLEEEKVTKMENMSFQTTGGVRLTKIVGARCSPNGSHLVLTDWDSKAFVMVELKKDEKIITGNCPCDVKWERGGH